MEALPDIPLPSTIRSRYVDGINGLRMHVLEAGFETSGRPSLLLLHGFPELAFSWRKVMPKLAAAGYHVIAPDQRGYGRTTGWSADYDGDLAPFRLPNLVRDAVGLVAAFGYKHVDAVVGHDFGSSVAAWCALIRPDVFRAVVMMSAPFSGPPSLPFNTANEPAKPATEDPVHRELAALSRPRKHYQWYYSTRPANADMHHAPQGVHDFLRAYYHHKSADWKDNRPYRLESWSAGELAKLPTYYVMDLAKDMAATVAEEMPSRAAIAANTWLPDRELAYYSAEYERTGFQGGLQWYRCGTSGAFVPELQTWSGRSIDQPSAFISGKQDWGTYQRPGVFEAMQGKACTRMIGCHLVDGAGHWVQQEQPDEVSRLLFTFLREAGIGP
ncbi:MULTISPECIES: alpha/beta hydrolase [Bradyrhizobium]|jgi:pimeloyl-ACP methyl ester carboxylesterase|uniref:alpha/beta fold hydrolase n=1 Tax=Bradyrhizobium TaxID=374 RepID=UPI00040C0CA8|nr:MULTISPECIES: alpha/beta hydrolase [Bradyrhizobium]KIU46837.1 alpha/beta hydrolase [Bradyrhizobium elkanii]MBK5653883.1 alpha/beta fold hydrolase [Rhizobium sp.]OCX29676.1 alpha/beta hydrolase [Bradyrhizobium sp. UASWS1016]